MLRILVIIAAVLIVAVVAVLGVASTRPDTFGVKRSIAIKAPPEKIIGYIQDFRRWTAWSPYEKLDPKMQRTYSGADHGVGAVYAWAGEGKAGEGRMEILEVTPTRVRIKLDFLKPFEGHNIAVFALEPQGETTRVTWSMEGPSPFVAKVMGLFFNMDQMIGKDFEDGLADLKASAET